MTENTKEKVASIGAHGVIITLLPFIYVYVFVIWLLVKITKHDMIRKVE